MAKVSEIMSEDVAVVDPELTLRDALDVLRGEEVTGAPVVQNGEVVGVLSATDILEFQATNPGVPVRREEPREWGAFEDPEEWEEGDPVSGYFFGFWEHTGADVVERFETTDAPEWDTLEEHAVSEVMSRQLVALPPDAEVRDAARLMIDADVRRILVMENGELRGILSMTDLVRGIAEGRV